MDEALAAVSAAIDEAPVPREHPMRVALSDHETKLVYLDQTILDADVRVQVRHAEIEFIVNGVRVWRGHGRAP